MYELVVFLFWVLLLLGSKTGLGDVSREDKDVPNPVRRLQSKNHSCTVSFVDVQRRDRVE